MQLHGLFLCMFTSIDSMYVKVVGHDFKIVLSQCVCNFQCMQKYDNKSSRYVYNLSLYWF